MSPRPGSRAQTCGKVEARNRLSHARAFVDTAELVMVSTEGSENVAVSLAVLAGIAASDAACCAALGRRPRGPGPPGGRHDAVRIAEVGTAMGKDLARRLDIKDNAQFGIMFVSAKVAAQSVKWEQRVVDAAEAVSVG